MLNLSASSQPWAIGVGQTTRVAYYERFCSTRPARRLRADEIDTRRAETGRTVYEHSPRINLKML